MRVLSLAALLMIALPATSAGNEKFQIRDAADLVEICDTNPRAADAAVAAAFCHGYLVGAFHYYDAATPPEARFACAPEPKPTRTEVANGFVLWAKSHPQFMRDRAIETLFRFIAKTYPCPD